MKAEIDRIKAALIRDFPFICSLIRKAKIIESTNLPAAGGADRNGNVVINKNMWEKLDFKIKVYLIAHETLHCAFFHPQRLGNYQKMRWNIATDCVVDEILKEYIKIPKTAITATTVSAWTNTPTKEIQKMSAEEIYRLLPAEIDYEIEEDLYDKRFEGLVVQEGDRRINEEKDNAVKRELWKEAITNAYLQQKMAGRIPLGLKRTVEEMLKPKINVKNILAQTIRNGFGKTVVSNWVRPSRKNPELPWVKRMTVPDLWILVDTSGSIGRKELALFLGAVYLFAHTVRLNVICWDARSYEVITIKNKNEVLNRLAKKFKGGGGTVIYPVLNSVSHQMKLQDGVVILTDGEISDIEKTQTLKKFEEIRRKASVRVITTTGKKVSIPGWKTISFWRLEIFPKSLK